MNYNKLFFRFKVQMILEGILKTSLFSAMLGGGAVFLTSLIYHILTKTPSMKNLFIIFGVVFIISFLPRFLAKYFPTKKKIAKRIDEMGLQERISTMYEYRAEDREIFKLQRQDALVHLQAVTPRYVRQPLRLREWLAPVICLALALVMLLLPYNISASKDPDESTQESGDNKEKQIKALIEKLREEVDKSEAASSTDLEEQLNDIIDQMEGDLEQDSKVPGDSSLQQAATMDEAQEQMRDQIEEAISKDEIGEALQNHELTRELGEAISKGDTEGVAEALSNLKDKLNADNSLVEQLAQAVSDALEESAVKPQDGLYMALAQFAEDLGDTSAWVGAVESIEQLLNDDMDAAQAAIIMELEKQSLIESLMDTLEEIIEAAKDESLGNEPAGSDEEPGDQQGSGEEPGDQQGSGEEPGDQQGSGEEPGDQQGSGEEPGDQQGSGGEPGDQQGNGGQSEGQAGGNSGDGNSQGQMSEEGEDGYSTGHDMNEAIYDPISGDVPYGDVYAVYFAKYLEALKAGEVPEELREIIEAYFATLD